MYYVAFGVSLFGKSPDGVSYIPDIAQAINNKQFKHFPVGESITWPSMWFILCNKLQYYCRWSKSIGSATFGCTWRIPGPREKGKCYYARIIIITCNRRDTFLWWTMMTFVRETRAPSGSESCLLIKDSFTVSSKWIFTTRCVLLYHHHTHHITGEIS